MQCDVFDCWRSLETSNWSSGSSAGVSRCICRYTICMSIAWWYISQNRSANTRSCKYWILLNPPLSDFHILTTPENIQGWNWRLVQFVDGWHMGDIKLWSIVTSLIWAQRLRFGSTLRSFCLIMHTAPRSWIIRNYGSPQWKCLILFTTNCSSLLIAWDGSQQHHTISNLLLHRL